MLTLKFADTVMTYGILALLLWVTIPLGSNQAWAAMLFVLVVALMTTLWAAFNLSSNKINKNQLLRKAYTPFILLLLCQLWVACQWLFGITEHPSQTVYYLLLGLAYSFLYLLIIATFTSRQKLTLLIATLIFSGTIQAFYGAFLTLSGMEWRLFEIDTISANATGSFVNRNHFAGYLNMTIACGIGLLLALRSGEAISIHNVVDMLIGPKAKIRLALVIMVIALVMSHSRMGNSAFFISLMLVGSLFIIRNKANRLRNSLVLASIIVIDVLIISHYFGLERLTERLLATDIASKVIQVDKSHPLPVPSTIKDSQSDAAAQVESKGKPQAQVELKGKLKAQDENGITLSSGEEKIVIDVVSELRDEVIMSSLPLLADRPFIGQGAGSFEAVYQRYAGDIIRMHFDYAHNDYLQFLIEFGIIGTLPLVLFMLLSLSYAAQSLWHRRSRYRSGLGLGMLMAMLAILVHSFTDFNLQIPANAATFIVLCAAALITKHHTHDRKRSKKATS